MSSNFFFFNDTATTEIYTLSLHDALPISRQRHVEADAQERPDEGGGAEKCRGPEHEPEIADAQADRKSTRLNSSHGYISYAVFCLKKKKKYSQSTTITCTINITNSSN